MSPSALTTAVFAGLFDFDDQACYLRSGEAIATLMVDNTPTGIPTADGITAARTYFVVTKEMARNAPITVVGFAGQFEGQNVIHVVRG